MKYKIAAVDLDGTILNEENQVTEYTKKVLHRLGEAGVKIVIATGRSYSSLKPIQEFLELDNPIVCYNGAMIRDGKTGEPLFSSVVPEDVASVLVDLSRQYGVHFHGFSHEQLYFERESEQSAFYENHSGLKGTLTDFKKQDVMALTKGMFIADNHVLKEIRDILLSRFGSRIYTAFSKPIFLEVMDKEASKARALFRVLNMYNLKREELVAIGDSYNDVEMLNFAGLGVLMKNGTEALKESYINTDFDNNEDGAARFLNQLFKLEIAH